MKPINNYESVQASAGEFAKPSAGGYVCKIVNVEDKELDVSTGKGSYLRIEFDICEGEFAGYYKEQFTKWGGTWNASFIRSYKEKALGMFKHFINCVEKSNAGFEWSWNEGELIGKAVGLVLGEEEYINSQGAVRTKLVVKDIKTADDIRNKNFKVPEYKKVETDNIAHGTPQMPRFEIVSSDDELPFN